LEIENYLGIGAWEWVLSPVVSISQALDPPSKKQ
jgi:hypothetical protein